MTTEVLLPPEQQLRQDFLHAMRYTAASVAVVTTDGPAGRGGVTVSALSSLSAEPPSLLVCVHQLSPVLPLIQSNGRMCVNVLSADQVHVADSFAGRIAQWRDNRFACAQWSEQEGWAPALQGALVNLHCTLANDVVFGSHHVLMGQVVQVRCSEAPSLLYVDRGYRQLGEPATFQSELYV